jgi:hypothetical protein
MLPSNAGMIPFQMYRPTVMPGASCHMADWYEKHFHNISGSLRDNKDDLLTISDNMVHAE